MIEIHPKLFVGNEANAYTLLNAPGWYIIHACKEPFHREALGYQGKAAPKSHPEYLIARRENRLILNLVDAPDPAYIPKEIIDAAIEAIHKNIQHRNVLVHCNQGMSRSPTIALLYLLKYTDVFGSDIYSDAIETFKNIYPMYSPAKGVTMFAQQNWIAYKRAQCSPQESK